MAERKVYALTRLQRIGVAALFLTAIGLIAGSVFIWSGYYNVSAERAHWPVTTWLLTQVRDHSIRSRADDIAVPPLSDPGLIALGAEHYKLGCSTCHGPAGELQNPVYQSLLPRPPDLRFAADDYAPNALYWIVHSGLKYTGMPAWPAAERGDEVWAVVAFLAALNQSETAAIPALARKDGGAPLRDCRRCHGDADTAPISDRVPFLNGQREDYMVRALREYRAQRRPSGFMMPVAHGLSDDQIVRWARYYGGLEPLFEAQEAADPARVEAGRVLALEGDPSSNVPACSACHAGNAQIPKLAGQSRRYLEIQLRLWQTGARDDTPHGAIMAEIGERLSATQIAAVSTYYASLAGATQPH